MSELARQMGSSPKIKHRLLATASAVALAGTAFLSQALAGEDADRPTVWIELGGQLERIDARQQMFAPPFAGSFIADGYLPLAGVERTPRYGNGFEGTVTFEPHGSDWAFAVSVRYGRSNATRASHNQLPTPPLLDNIVSIPDLNIFISQPVSARAIRSGDASARTDMSDLVLDFRAGRDVGLGILKGDATFNLGVRVAQFTSKSHVVMTADSGSDISYKYATEFSGHSAYIKRPNLALENWDIYHATASISRNFKGAGPSLSFDDSIPLAGRPDAMQANLDFGLNGAILFGRQKAVVRQRIDDDRPVLPITGNFIPLTTAYHHRYTRVRSRSVIVPNIGGFAGLSFNYSNAKLKLGYRADFFFGAMDGGIDTRKTYDRDFYGPFATISIGLP